MSFSGKPGAARIPFSHRFSCGIAIQKAVGAVALATCAALPAGAADPIPDYQRKNPWFEAASTHVAQRLPATERGKARNVILFVGDGMGISTITASRIFAGQLEGNPGEEHRLSFEEYPFTGLVKTYNTNAQTADSAGTMSAMMTGVKTNISMFGLDEDAELSDCDSSHGNELVTLLELAEISGRSTGVVSTARLTHATPGATYARTADRAWENIAQLSREARRSGCRDIAVQLLEHESTVKAMTGTAIDGIEVALGGGRWQFLPKEPSEEQRFGPGHRIDNRDLIEEWLGATAGTYVSTREELMNAGKEGRLLGLFSGSHMNYEADRPPEQPSLSEMTAAALDRLQQDEDGFFLMVESGRIDHAHHANNAFNALNETVEFDRAIALAAERTDPEDTLIIVTADHSHVFTIAGYPKRGNPILGKVVRPGDRRPEGDVDGKPYTTLGYMNGRGFRDLGDETDADAIYKDNSVTAGRADLSRVDTTEPGYHQEVLVPLGAETHGGEDVAVYARGPGAIAVSGSIEQNVIFHVMAQAAGLTSAEAGEK
jgi:alkaline phosphatase